MAKYLDLPKALAQIEEAGRLLHAASYSLFEQDPDGPLQGNEPLLAGGLAQAVDSFAEMLRSAQYDGCQHEFDLLRRCTKCGLGGAHIDGADDGR